MIEAYDSVNVQPSSKEEVTMKEVLKNDNSHRMILDEPEESEESFGDDEVVIESHEIHDTDSDFSMENPMTNNLVKSLEDSTFPMFEPPCVEHRRDSKSDTLLDVINKVVKELGLILDSTIQIEENLKESQSPEKVIEQPKNVLLTDYKESNVFIGLWMLMKLFFNLFHSQKCGLLWVAREILSQELLSGQLTGFYQSLRGLFKQILSSNLLSGQLCYIKKVRGLFHQILSSDLLSGQLC